MLEAKNSSLALTINEQRMTSIRIAEISGKPHNDVMKAIRTMEPAWEKVGRGNFSLTSYTDKWNRPQPMYDLSFYECMYIASKFNDETRARIISEWAELREKERISQVDPLHGLEVHTFNERKLILLEQILQKLNLAAPEHLYTHYSHQLINFNGVEYISEELALQLSINPELNPLTPIIQRSLPAGLFKTADVRGIINDFIKTHISTWLERGYVAIKDFDKDLLRYIARTGLSFKPSPVMINKELQTYCTTNQIHFEKDVVRRNGNTTCRCKKFIDLKNERGVL